MPYVLIFLICMIVGAMFNESGGLLHILQTDAVQKGLAAFMVALAVLLILARTFAMMTGTEQKES